MVKIRQRVLAGLAAAVLLCGMLPATAMASARDTGDDAFCLSRAIALAEQMDRMAESEYITMMSGMPDLLDTAAEIGSYSYDSPMLAAVATFNLDVLLQMLGSGEDVTMPPLSDDILRIAERRAVQALPSMINGQNGATMLATASVLTTGESYLSPSKAFVDRIVGFVYEDSPYMVLCTFTRGGEDIVTANATFVKPMESVLEMIMDADTLGAEEQAMLGEAGVAYTVYRESELANMLEVTP